MIRLAAPIVALLLVAALVAGCGSGGSTSGSSTAGEPGTAGGTATSGGDSAPAQSGAPAKKPPSAEVGGAPIGAQATPCDTYAVDAEALRATGISCKAARQAMFAWQRAHSCELAPSASRGACTVGGGLRCQAVRAGEGIAVGCAGPEHAIAFRVKRG